MEPKNKEKQKAWKGVAYARAQMVEISEEEKGEFHAAAAGQGF